MTGRPTAQTPSRGQIFLDHVGWFVNDMTRTAEKFRRLGLPMTPFTIHRNQQPDGNRIPSGTANRCAMVKRGYLEVLVSLPEIETPLTAQMNAGLARYEGLHLIAFSVADTHAEADRLHRSGFTPAPPVSLRRPMPLDDGGEAEARFSVLRVAADDMPEGRVQILSHGTPEVVWQPSVTADSNALRALSGLLVATDRVDETAGRFARFTGRPAQPAGASFRIPLDRGEIVICSAAACRTSLPGLDIPCLPFMAAVAIESQDIKVTRAFLHDIPLAADEPDRIVLHRNTGAGAAFVFHADSTDPFPVT